MSMCLGNDGWAQRVHVARTFFAEKPCTSFVAGIYATHMIFIYRYALNLET